MTYSESAKGIKISRKRALAEVNRHGIDETVEPEYSEFVEWLGSRKTVDAFAVLEWLGY